MQKLTSIGIGWLTLTLLAAGCAAPPAQRGAEERAAEGQRVAGPKRITAAIMGNPPSPYVAMTGGSGGSIPGQGGLEAVVIVALTVRDDRNVIHPQLGEAVPSIENGLWRVLPDGRMETTWRIREGATWHDGTPFTSEDVLFTTRVLQDRELPVSRNPVYDVIQSIQAPDSRTVTVTWKQAFIEADDFLTTQVPMPRHLLERTYLDDKANLPALPYWADEFVGNGPFKVREWVRDSHVVLQAYDRYVLGRANIDELVVKFIPDENAFIANILAGVVEVSLGKSITLEQTLQLKEQWREGHVEISPETAMKIWPQFINPNPVVVTDVRFRRAMLHAIDRQQLNESIMGGLSSVAHTVLLPNEPEFNEVQDAVVRYEYDPRRASQLIEETGHTRAADGLYRDGAGQRLTVELSATASDQNTKPLFAVADYWQRVGVGVDPVVIPIQRQRDREYRATFPAFTLQGGESGVGRLKELHSVQARLPENNYTGGNYSRYRTPEFDALIERFVTTIPRAERMQVLKQVVHHMSDQLNMMNLFYAATTTMVANRLVNVGRAPSWNAHQWDLS